MIKGIHFCIHHSSKIKKLGLVNAHLHFKSGYNVLIGPNGSGKSTVLKALASCSLCHLEKTGKEQIKYITMEILNPRVGGTFATREEMIQGIRSKFFSHGEGVLDSLRNQSHVNETVVLIDSPETGQDHEHCEGIYEGLLKMSQRYQVIIATNSLVFMQSGHLIDLGGDYLSKLIKGTGKLAVSLGYGTKGNKKTVLPGKEAHGI